MPWSKARAAAGPVAEATTPVLDLRSATFGYAGRAVAHDLTLRVREGEVVALLGPNGSGKSTLVKGVLGLADHLGGEVEVLGRPRQDVNRSRMGYVPQRHTLSGAVRSTVTEVVATGRLALRPWWRPAGGIDRQRVREAIDKVGLADRVATDVATLSGGQQRRVLIARALAADPHLLLLDEPMAGVDTASQDVLAEVLQRLASSGVTLVVVTHEVDALHAVLDRIVAMDRGRICFDDTPRAYGLHRRAPGHRHDGHQHHDDEELLPVALLGSGPLDRRGAHRGSPR